MNTPPPAGPTSNPLSVQPPERFLRLLNAANHHFQPTTEFARLLTLHHARALWGLGRTDENLAANMDLILEANHDQVEAEYEDADQPVHAVLAAAALAERRAARRRLNEADRHLNRFSVTANLLGTLAPQV
jgi:hypothetical protein